jgi:hypothetical protein
MERIAPGAAAKTIRENRPNMRILLQHGRDPQLGDKPIAPIEVVTENDIGGYAEGRLFDGLDPLVVEGLRAGVYGASFRFRVLREEIVDEPGVSEYNPKGLPERTIKEMGVQEMGPVTWGAYSEASAGVRSITDEMYFGAMRGMPTEKLQEVASFWRNLDGILSPTRMDSEDAGTLAEMIVLASQYIEDQDEDDAGEQPLTTAMQGIQSSLIELLNAEAVENEPDEPEDEEAGSAPSGETPERRAGITPAEAPPAKGTPTSIRKHTFAGRKSEREYMFTHRKDKS